MIDLDEQRPYSLPEIRWHGQFGHLYVKATNGAHPWYRAELAMTRDTRRTDAEVAGFQRLTIATETRTDLDIDDIEVGDVVRDRDGNLWVSHCGGDDFALVFIYNDAAPWMVEHRAVHGPIVDEVHRPREQMEALYPLALVARDGHAVTG